MEKKKFIYVFDKQSRDKLIAQGLTLLCSALDGQYFVFENSGATSEEVKYTLSEDKFVFSNSMFF